MGIRRPHKIEYAAGEFLDLPKAAFEYESSQELYGGTANLTGAHYEYDLLGGRAAPKRNAIERLRFLVLDESSAEINAAIDEMRAKLHEGGRVNLWTLGSEFDLSDAEVETERWAPARIISMPSIRLETLHRRHAPLILAFQRFGDWREEDLLELTFPIDSEPEAFTVTNPGSAKVYDAVLTLSGTFSLVGIHNRTNGRSFVSTRTGAGVNDWLRIDAGRRRVDFSDDGGTSYVGDWDLVTRLAGQTQLMMFEPGDNEFEVFGGSSASLEISFYPKWH